LESIAKLTPRNTPLPRVLSCRICSLWIKHYESNHGDQPGKFVLSRPVCQHHSRSSDPTRIDLLPMTSYYHFIAARVLSRTVSEINGDFGQYLKFSPPVYLTSRCRDFPWNWETLDGPKKPGRERSLRIFLAVWIQYRSVTDTERQTDTGRQLVPRLRVLSRDKTEITLAAHHLNCSVLLSYNTL